jgi:putative flippase GtrA
MWLSKGYYNVGDTLRILKGTKMGNIEMPKIGTFGILKNFILFNIAAVVGFILGTFAFTGSMFIFPNPTFAWLFANAIGGLSHFAANYLMQRQTKEKIVKNFIVFNATGIIGFIVATATFAVVIIYIQDSTSAWLLGSLVGTLAHFILNHKATKQNPKHPTTTN